MKQIRIRRNTRKPWRCISASLAAVVLSALLATPALAAAPGNDERSTATTINKLPYSDRMDATNATASETDPANHYEGDPDTDDDDYSTPICSVGGTVWYSFTPNHDVRLVADTQGSDYDTILAAFAGEPTKKSMLVCNDNWRSAQSRASFEAKSGQTYFFMISGGSPGVLEFHLRATKPPANDEMARARTIRVDLPYSDHVDTTDATLNVNDPSCSGRARSVWYKYQRPERWGTRRIELTTGGSDYNTSISVYTGPRYALKQLECSGSRVRFPAESGKTYWVMVAAANNSEGGSLNLRAKNMPVPFKMRFGVDGTGRISSVTGATHVSGQMECNKKASMYISVVLRQTQPNGKIKSASESKSVNCDKRGKWSLNLVSDERPFTEGQAGVWVEVRVPSRNRERDAKKLIDLRSCDNCL